MRATNTQRMLADLAEQGGGTYDSLTLLPFRPRDGFAVAIGGVKLPASSVTDATLRRWVKAVRTEHGSTFVGTWLDDGIVYIDAVKYIRDAPRAYSTARAHQQKAVWNFATGEAEEV